jgi:hypothetical protein
VERFSVDPATRQLTRSYTADDPVYLAAQYAGSDTIGVADVPYSPDKCSELTFVDFSKAGQAGEPARAPASTPAKPWWKFWD